MGCQAGIVFYRCDGQAVPERSAVLAVIEYFCRKGGIAVNGLPDLLNGLLISLFSLEKTAVKANDFR